MPKLRLLILDANVVITLHDLGIWSQVVDKCDIHLSRTVVKESVFSGCNEAEGVSIDLSADENDSRITVFDLDASAIKDFQRNFDSSYAGKLDAGECESLAHLESSKDEYLICSADAIVYKILGNLNRREQGISLEEVLQAIGRGRKLDWKNSKAFREKYTSEGETDSIYGKGRRARD